MNIGEAAKKSNLPIKTVRFYSDIGIIIPKTNETSNYRIFSNQDIEKLLLTLIWYPDPGVKLPIEL